MTPDEKPTKGRGWTRAVQDAGPYLGMGIGLAVMVLVCLGAGYWLDGRLGTSPWFFLLGGVFGMAAAGYHFYRTVSARQR
jgi:F0F1-type ATP synthase assembly protein I